MKLLYLWLKDYGIFKNCELNFTDEYRFHFDYKNKKLELIENNSKMVNLFNKDDESPINEISAIVGDNGSGKTTIAKFLYEVFALKKIHEAIIIYNINNNNYIYSTIIPEIIEEKEFEKIKNSLEESGREGFIETLYKSYEKIQNSYKFNGLIGSNINYIFNELECYENIIFPDFLKKSTTNARVFSDFNIIYLSSFYNPFHPIDTNVNFNDISTSSLLKWDPVYFYNKKLGTNYDINNIVLELIDYDKFQSILSSDLVSKNDKKVFSECYSYNQDINKYVFSEIKNREQLEILQKILLLIDFYGRSESLNQLNAHGYMEMKRNCEFFTAYKNKNINLNLNIPLNLMISINEGDGILFDKEIEKTDYKYISEKINMKYEEELKKSSTLKEEFILSISKSIIKNFLRNKISINTPLELINHFISSLNDLILKSNEKMDNSIIKFFNTIGKIFIMNKRETSYDVKESKPIIELITFLKQLDESFFRFKNYIYLNIDESFDKIKIILDNYFNSYSATHYLNFYWDPYISSGEYAQFNVYSRLYSIIKEKQLPFRIIDPINNLTSDYLNKEELLSNYYIRNNGGYILKDGLSNDVINKVVNELRKAQNIIIFLDEIETTLHPSFQKSLIYDLNKFLKIYFDCYNIHLIFATHSPIILSDIPRENVVFLKKNQDDKENIKCVVVNDSTPTFGANIHSLYKHPFFMNEGVMGKFAESKIDEVIELIKEGKELDYCRYIISKIGESIIRNQLEKMLEKKELQDKVEKHDKEINNLKKEIDDLKGYN